MARLRDIYSRIKALLRHDKIEKAVAKLLSMDSAKIVVSIVLLAAMMWLLLSIFVFPSPPPVYDERISLKVHYTGNLQRWTANFDFFGYHNASSRSFNLQLTNLSTNPKCLVAFSIYPFMPHNDREAEVTIIKVVPHMDLKTTLTTDIDYVSVRLNNSKFIEEVALKVAFNQPPLFERVLPPYGRVIFQTEVKSDQEIPLSKFTITTPAILTVDEFEPSREVASVRYQGLLRITEIEPQRSDALVVAQLARKPSSLIPLALNFVSLLSVINLVYAFHRSLKNKEHRFIMYVLGFLVATIWTIIIWFMFL